MAAEVTADLVAELRAWNGNGFGPYASPVPDILDAADALERQAGEIERLTRDLGDLDSLWRGQRDVIADRDRLRTALENLLDDTQHSGHTCLDQSCPVRAARAALAVQSVATAATPGDTP